MLSVTPSRSVFRHNKITLYLLFEGIFVSSLSSFFKHVKFSCQFWDRLVAEEYDDPDSNFHVHVKADVHILCVNYLFIKRS